MRRNDEAIATSEAGRPAAHGARRWGSSLSIRRLTVASIVLFGVLVVGQVIGLVWTSRIVWSSAQQMDRDARAVDASHEIDRAIREYHRLGNLVVATGEPELRAARSESEADLHNGLVQVARYADDAPERRTLAELEENLTTYFAARESAEARRIALDRMVLALRPSLDRVLAASAELRRHNESDRDESRERAEQALRAQSIGAAASVFVLAVALVTIAMSIHRLVVRPVLGLRESVRRFRSGETGYEASGGHLAELRELADRINEMTEAIVQQRRDQLTFLAGVAHDLRNPLSGLKMIVQNLEREPSAATPDRYRRLDRQLDRLTRMVGDLLDATRIESGHLSLQLERVDLRDAARATVELYAPTTTAHEITLEAPEKPVMVEGDPLRLEQVVGNLVNNAIKYSPRGGAIRISVATHDDWVELAVSDRGVGIRPEDLPNLFLPFRTRPNTPELPQGVGLGLSIVRRIVTAHGGRIDVESTPGVGTTFRVRLPLAARAAHLSVATR